MPVSGVDGVFSFFLRRDTKSDALVLGLRRSRMGCSFAVTQRAPRDHADTRRASHENGGMGEASDGSPMIP